MESTPSPPSGSGLIAHLPVSSGAQTPLFDPAQPSRAASPHPDQQENAKTTYSSRRTSTMLGRELEEHINWSGLDDGLSYKDFRHQLAKEEKKEFTAKVRYLLRRLA